MYKSVTKFKTNRSIEVFLLNYLKYSLNWTAINVNFIIIHNTPQRRRSCDEFLFTQIVCVIRQDWNYSVTSILAYVLLSCHCMNEYFFNLFRMSQRQFYLFCIINLPMFNLFNHLLSLNVNYFILINHLRNLSRQFLLNWNYQLLI